MPRVWSHCHLPEQPVLVCDHPHSCKHFFFLVQSSRQRWETGCPRGAGQIRSGQSSPPARRRPLGSEEPPPLPAPSKEASNHGWEHFETGFCHPGGNTVGEGQALVAVSSEDKIKAPSSSSVPAQQYSSKEFQSLHFRMLWNRDSSLSQLSSLFCFLM